MKVAVISVFYNRESVVARSAESLLSQTCNDYKICLVDDGSTDGTFDELKKFESPICEVRSSQNLGFTKQLIHTINNIDSEYIAIHGSGDISYPERLAEQMKMLDNDPEIGVVGCNIVEDRGPELPRMEHLRHVDRDSSDRLLHENFLIHGEAMIRRSTYDQVGGYRPFFAFAQDRDLWCRISRVSQFGNCEQVLYERTFQDDGVAVKPKSRLAQFAFSDFAIYCHKECLAGRDDPLDRLGPAAMLLRAPSARLTEKVIHQSLRLLNQDQDGLAHALARAGHVYRPSMRTRIGLFALKYPFLWAWLRRIRHTNR